MLTTESLAEYSLSVSFDDLPEAVVEGAERLLIDSIGCCLGGYASPPSKTLRSLYGGESRGGATATVIGSGERVPVEYAALLNGAMIRYLDFNDTYRAPHGGCHPSDAIPALLAVAEAEGASGADLIEAMAVAYEIQCGGVATGATRRAGFDYVTWGTHGTAAAAGKLMGLSEDELASALGIAVAANNALEITRLGEVSMWKGVAQAYGNHSAIHACQMAREGLTGPTGAYDGPNGLIEVMAVEDIDLDDLALGEPYGITRTCFKPYAACHYATTAIDAVFELTDEHGIDPDGIESIDVGLFGKAIDVTATEEKWATDLTRETADHSLPYILAVALLDGEVTPAQYGEDRLRDGRVHDLMASVSVHRDDDLEAFLEDHPSSIPTTVAIRAGGDTYEKRLDYFTGHPEKPMSDDAIEGKMRGLSSPYLADGQIDSAIGACRELDALDGVEGLVEDLVV